MWPLAQECRAVGQGCDCLGRNAGEQERREAGAARAGMPWHRDAAAGTGMQSILVAWAGTQGSRNAGQQECRDESRQSRDESGWSRDAPRPLSLQPLTFLHRTQLGAGEGNADGKSWQEPAQVPAAPGFQLI